MCLRSKLNCESHTLKKRIVVSILVSKSANSVYCVLPYCVRILSCQCKLVLVSGLHNAKGQGVSKFSYGAEPVLNIACQTWEEADIVVT